MAKVHVMDHPLITHKISYIRSEEVGTKEFREMIGEIAQLMCYEATRDLKLEDVQIKTPICEMTGKSLAGKKLAIVPSLPLRKCGLKLEDKFNCQLSFDYSKSIIIGDKVSLMILFFTLVNLS